MKLTDRGRSISSLQAHEELMESLAMLSLLALSRQSVADGAVKPLDEAAEAIVARTSEGAVRRA